MISISYCTALSTVWKYKIPRVVQSENPWNKYNFATLWQAFVLKEALLILSAD